jgi:hypothetical protein
MPHLRIAGAFPVSLPRPRSEWLRSLPPHVVAVRIGAALVAVAGVFVIAGVGAESPKMVRSSVLSVELPSGWTRLLVGETAGVPLTGAVAAAPGGQQRATLVAGVARDEAAVRRLVRRASASSRGRATVSLGELRAWRWTDVPLTRAGPSTVFVAYTSRGPLVALCRAAGASGPESSQCSDALRTLELTRARPVALRSIVRMRRALQSTIETLRTQQTAGRRAIATAPSFQEQARAAGELEASFVEASEAVAATRTPPGTADLTPVAKALSDTAGAYGRLSDAIASGDAVTYDAARSDIVANEARSNATLADVGVP